MGSDIIIAIQQGNERAFQQFYQESYDKLYCWLLGKTRSEYLAEELLQQTFITIWSARHRLNPEMPIGIQLFRTARSLMIDMLRKRALDRKLVADLTERESNVISFDFAKETQAIVDRTLSQLHPTGQKAFRLSRENGLSYAQISEELSISPKTVEYHISKALHLLKQNLLVYLIFLFLQKGV